jgi:transketolase
LHKSNNYNASKLIARIITAATAANEGHVPSALSILDIVWVLYNQVMKFNEIPDNSDRFVLSKGHASLALYAVLEEAGLIPHYYLDEFCQYDAALGGHPDCKKVPYIEASTGSLGHGMPMALGMALASKIKNKKNKVYCLVGDGECNEGTVWETALLASHHRLSNFICIVDYNHSTDRALDMGNIGSKFASFGWSALTINGHDHIAISDAMKTKVDRPLAVICETIKGNGIQRMERQPAWHHKSPTADELADILGELE